MRPPNVITQLIQLTSQDLAVHVDAVMLSDFYGV